MALRSMSRQRIWLDGMIMNRYPVTNQQYLHFLNHLMGSDREKEALQWVPRALGGHAGKQGAIIYGRTADGFFELVADAEDDLWQLDWPVMMVDWSCAAAYAEWKSEEEGLQWRLPSELEWEKAARGVDGRFFPWGDGFNPSFACMSQSHKDARLPAAVDSYPVDTTVYGIRGMAGNMMDWTASLFKEEGPTIENHRIAESIDLSNTGSDRVLRGGGWGSLASYLRSAGRSDCNPDGSYYNNGFRLSRCVP